MRTLWTVIDAVAAAALVLKLALFLGAPTAVAGASTRRRSAPSRWTRRCCSPTAAVPVRAEIAQIFGGYRVAVDYPHVGLMYSLSLGVGSAG